MTAPTVVKLEASSLGEAESGEEGLKLLNLSHPALVCVMVTRECSSTIVPQYHHSLMFESSNQRCMLTFS
uniref:Uncharacterized protein n=1 Tax=Anguilla anguilla TaxID=7936 RepID=A0A0E9Q7U9_ANGAN